MKREIIFTFACVMALMSGFVSCTNEDFEDCMSVAEMQKSAKTRSVGGMTKEEVLARLDELGEKYSIDVNMLYVRDYSKFTESTFDEIENRIISKFYTNDAEACTIQTGILIEDNIVDEYDVASTSSVIEDNPLGPVNEYNCDFQIEYGGYVYDYNMDIKCDITECHNTAKVYFTDNSSHNKPSSCHQFSTAGVFSTNNSTYFYFSFYISVSYPTRKTFLVEGKYDNGISYMYAPNLKIIR